jgi:hypothetical protein
MGRICSTNGRNKEDIHNLGEGYVDGWIITK